MQISAFPFVTMASGCSFASGCFVGWNLRIDLSFSTIYFLNCHVCDLGRVEDRQGVDVGRVVLF